MMESKVNLGRRTHHSSALCAPYARLPLQTQLISPAERSISWLAACDGCGFCRLFAMPSLRVNNLVYRQQGVFGKLFAMGAVGYSVRNPRMPSLACFSSVVATVRMTQLEGRQLPLPASSHTHSSFDCSSVSKFFFFFLTELIALEQTKNDFMLDRAAAKARTLPTPSRMTQRANHQLTRRTKQKLPLALVCQCWQKISRNS